MRNAVGNSYLRESGASIKCAGFNLCDAAGHVNFCESGAVAKSSVSDYCNTVRDADLRESGASIKSVGFDLCNAAGNVDLRKSRATKKCV